MAPRQCIRAQAPTTGVGCHNRTAPPSLIPAFGQAGISSRHRYSIKARMPLVWSCPAVKPHSRVSGAPKAQGLTAQARTERQFGGPRRCQKKLADRSLVCWTLFDLPEVTAFSSRFDASDRRRIGEVGAGRSHPHRRRRTASRAHQAGSLARVPPRPSLTGELTAAVPEGTAESRDKVGRRRRGLR